MGGRVLAEWVAECWRNIHLYIAAALEADEHDISVLDCQVYMDEFITWKWGGRNIFGTPWTKLAQEIRQLSPDIVGISNQFTIQLDCTVEVAKIVKGIDRDIVTVVGGNHASILPNSFFRVTDCVDIVCMGEGELRLPEVIRCLEGNKKLEDVNGIAFRKNGVIVISKQGPFLTNQELNGLPFPAYHLIPMDRYFRLQKKGYYARGQYEYSGSHRAVSMITSRGCPYGCTFCSIHLHMGRGYRTHSVSNVLDHIELLTSRYGVRHIHFEDDNLTLNRRRFNKLLDGLLERKFGITWGTPNGVRADLLPKELIAKSKDTGCTHFVIGVESGKQTNIDRFVKKKLRLEKVEQTARVCKKLGLDLGAFFIIGFPQETIDDMQTTLDFALKLERKYDVFLILSVLKPLIGTEVYKEAQKKEYFIEDVTHATMAASIAVSGIIETENFTRSDVARLTRGFYRRHKCLILKKMTRFFLQHPKGLVRLIDNLRCSPDRKQTLRLAMTYTNCLIRDFE
ncbi:B12-binding domain-containing radical SAM protein, partial [Thermodesulfobacteriota bacterium]